MQAVYRPNLYIEHACVMLKLINRGEPWRQKPHVKITGFRRPLLVQVALLTCIACFTPAPAHAAAENLVSLYQKALQYDAQYRGVIASTEADREEINKARSLFLPKLQLSANVGKGSTDRTIQTFSGPLETSTDYNLRNYALSIKQPLFNKESMAAYRATQATILSKEALLRKENSTLIGRISSNYFEVLYAQDKIGVINNKIVSVSQQLQQAQRRYDQGQGTITEINEAQATLDLAHAELIDANNTLENYRQLLSDITGQPILEIATLSPDRLPTSIPDYEKLEDWLQNGESNNTDIAAARFALDAARQDVERKRAGHYPTLDLVGVRSFSENDNNNTIGQRFDTTTIALQLSMPLYAGGFNDASVRQSYDRVVVAEEQLNMRSRDAGTNLRKYFNNIKSELLSIQAYRQAVKSSEIAYEGTQKGFIAGIRTNIEVLNAQQKVFASKLDLSKAQYMLVNDIVNLKQTAGLLDETQLQSVNQYFSSTN